ncbi:MAG TPA: GNAT family N-acetyltransferase [Candidatus Dormibacteraeota bacterium]|nr:GNAT family N-acetyltransferase [Candidatus Dormibacteraeota bacterium]
MRPGRIEDLPQIVELWRHEVEVGRQDAAPNVERAQVMLGRLNWETSSRVVERDREIDGSALVIARPGPDGVLADVYAAGRGDAYFEVTGWAVRFARAAGASIVHVMAGKGHGARLEELGLNAVRPWWRMDRSLSGDLPNIATVPGYELVDGSGVAEGTWEETFNRSFADHWRFVPRTEPEIVRGKAPELCLMAVTAPGRRPAAIAISEVEEYLADPRPQPVGLVGSVGTVPEHRRRGLAGWLVASALPRLRDAGARHASLYVDGLNPTRAYDVYRKLGFEVAYEAEVWEATSP